MPKKKKKKIIMKSFITNLFDFVFYKLKNIYLITLKMIF
jgi:hypothetical protein